ncbi:hypothetical protein GUITHDRAFT_141601 [Guillardia theta CCMP2712]|uniref:Uncharacterized protein n=1 Tax=Guillardia theta (strain CCMP2712) TaxID=905079 RepID=L1J040_GUITC|nr:hypothetical protein GUITHDRAFT_141601 [Guillardia theta CCMP2712]EKX41841.1 hypothetical protein GUITHDRAFT_141601 [Guillardia theta CCMP2712]|eukprot:XP_005828821.1 hypothetical protein GUITHDRAFT_141601 [Guillardia theta CCMP2712]
MTVNAHGAMIQSEIEISQTRGEVLSMIGPLMKLPEAVTVHDGSDILMRGFDYKEELRADCTEIKVAIEQYHKSFSVVSSIPSHLPRDAPEAIRGKRLFVCGLPRATVSSCFFAPRRLPARLLLRIVADTLLHPTILCEPGEKCYQGPLGQGKHAVFFSIGKEEVSDGLRIVAGEIESIREFVRAYPEFAVIVPDGEDLGSDVVNIAGESEAQNVSTGPGVLTTNDDDEEDDDDHDGYDDDVVDSEGSNEESLYVPSSFFGFLPGSANHR